MMIKTFAMSSYHKNKTSLIKNTALIFKHAKKYFVKQLLKLCIVKNLCVFVRKVKKYFVILF